MRRSFLDMQPRLVAHYTAVPRFGLRIQTPQCTLVVWSAADYEEGSFLTRRGRLSLACSGRQLPAGWPLISSSLPSSGLSSRSSSHPQAASAPTIPFHPHAARRVTPGKDKPRKPEVSAVDGIPRGGTDNCILSVASGRGKKEAATVIIVACPWPEPLLPQGLLEMHRGPACHCHDRAWG